MAHLKREQSPKQWPIERKGTAYLVRPRFSIDQGVPILIVMRDILKLAKTRREVRRALNAKQILLNGKEIFDEKSNALLFDVITIRSPESSGKEEKNYKVVMGKNKKFNVEEIPAKEAEHKISKVTNKKVLKGKKIQINLSDGRNFVSDIKCNVNDSVVVNFNGKKIEKCIPLKKGSDIFVFAGKHAGEKGKIQDIDEKNKIVEMESEGNKVNILIKQLIVLN